MPDEIVYRGIEKTEGTALNGKKVWYFIQGVTEPLASKALLPAFQTEGGVTYGGENVDEQTKMGRIIQKATDEHSIDLSQYFATGDKSIKVLTDAKKKGQNVKVWRVITDESVAETAVEGTHKLYPAEFGYGMPDDIEISDGTELVEVSYTLNIIGSLQDGKFPLADEDIEMLEKLYAYQNPGDTTGDLGAIDDGTPVG